MSALLTPFLCYWSSQCVNFGYITSLLLVFTVCQLWLHHIFAIVLPNRSALVTSLVFAICLRSVSTLVSSRLCYWSSRYVMFDIGIHSVSTFDYITSLLLGLHSMSAMVTSLVFAIGLHCVSTLVTSCLTGLHRISTLVHGMSLLLVFTVCQLRFHHVFAIVLHSMSTLVTRPIFVFGFHSICYWFQLWLHYVFAIGLHNMSTLVTWHIFAFCLHSVALLVTSHGFAIDSNFGGITCICY